MVSSVYSQTKCFVCADIGDGSCTDNYIGSSEHETECSAIGGYTDDGGCSKTKNKAKALGIWITTSKFEEGGS